MRDPAADRADHPGRNEEPSVDVGQALLAVAAVEHVVARERADLLAGLNGCHSQQYYGLCPSGTMGW